MGGSATKRPALPPSSFLTRLTAELQRKLQKALDRPSERKDLLRQLFTDVALEVDPRVQAKLYSSDQLFDDDERPRTATGSEAPLCFYEVFAQHFVEAPDAARKLLPLFLKLWSQSFASQIFSLLFYRWLFEVGRHDSEGFLRYSTAFVEGASNIFWIDLQSNVRRFFSLFNYAFEDVIMLPFRLERVPAQVQQDLALLLSRYFFFYEPAERLEMFLQCFPRFSNIEMGPTDVFVTEVTDQLHKVKVEPVLVHYLHSLKVLKGAELWATTSTRLKSALYSFTAPGGPMYPTRPVRHAAWETLDVLFPIGLMTFMEEAQVGRHPRLIISLFFRLLHPLHWPFSAWNVVKILTQALYRRTLIMLFDAIDCVTGAPCIPYNPSQYD